MLNKQICKKCINEKEDEMGIFSWHSQDEKDWAEGSDFSCVFRTIGIENDPPDDCFYFVEQFLHHDATKEEVKC